MAKSRLGHQSILSPPATSKSVPDSGGFVDDAKIWGLPHGWWLARMIPTVECLYSELCLYLYHTTYSNVGRCNLFKLLKPSEVIIDFSVAKSVGYRDI